MSDCTAGEARELVDGIRANLEGLADLIRRAYEGRAWVALGYGTWAVLCQREFGGGFQLPSGQRREVVRELTGTGMSTRAIGSALGVDQRTVASDARAENSAPARVVGLDGKRYTPPVPRKRPPAPPVADRALTDLMTAVNRGIGEALDARADQLAAAPLYLIQGLRASCADLARRLDDAERICREVQ